MEAHRIHFAHDLESCVVVKRKAGLIEQAVGAGAPRLTGGIEPDTGFAEHSG